MPKDTPAPAGSAIALLSVAVIKADQDVIKVNLTKLDMSIHANAVQCMLHAEKHGDTSLMRRLLVDIIDDKTGYRRQGLINWMRKYSPMELKGTVINLAGLDDQGQKRQFDVIAANDHPFWTDVNNREVVAKPVFRDNLMSKFNAGIREYRAAASNTLIGADGKPAPIDVTKPFFDGIYTDEVSALVDNMEAQLNKLTAEKPDTTAIVRKAQRNLNEALAA